MFQVSLKPNWKVWSDFTHVCIHNILKSGKYLPKQLQYKFI